MGGSRDQLVFRLNSKILRRRIERRILVLALLLPLICSLLISVKFLTINNVNASSSLDAGSERRARSIELATTFVEQVAELNSSTRLSQPPSWGESKRPNSPHTMTDVKIVVGNGSDALETVTTFLDCNFWCYNLYSPIQLLEGQKSLSECLAIANLTITRYRALFNSTSSDGLIEMLSKADTNKTSTVENDNALLKVTLSTNSSESLYYPRFVAVEWYKKIENQFITLGQSIRLYISQSGLLTGFSDAITNDYVATTDVNISEVQASNISRSCAEAYATANGLDVASSVITLNWTNDNIVQRGDDLAIYPVWNCYELFNDTSKGLWGYTVSLWADNGQVFEQGPYGPALTFSDTARPATFAGEFQWVLLGVALTAVGLILSLTYLRRRHSRSPSDLESGVTKPPG